MSDFITMVNRIAAELRRSNMTNDIKNAINDAIKREAKQRFYFNEVIAKETPGYTFATVAGQEYYGDMGFVEVDAMYYLIGSARYEILPWSQRDADASSQGSVSSGQPTLYSRAGGKFRLWPVPNSIVTVYVDGYGRLSPFPLNADTDTNSWMTEGEPLIRASAKAILLQDVIRDVTEATVYEALASDRRSELEDHTVKNGATGVIRPTQW